MSRAHGSALGAALLAMSACAGPGPGSAAQPGPVRAAVVPPPVATYRLLAAAESEDEVALIEFSPCPSPADRDPAPRVDACGARVVRTYPVGLTPSDIESPHGIIASPDGKTFYVTIAHGRPTGFLQKYDMASGALIDQVELGMFPATVDISPSGTFLYAINFNFEDPEMRPSSLSIVDGATMTEVARPVTCRMPHGSRLNPQGTKHYSGCMMNDLLVEVDAHTFEVSRLFDVAPGAEGNVAVGGAAAHAQHTRPGAAGSMSHGEHTATTAEMSSECSPTWAQPSADGSSIFVACNRSGEIVEVDADAWTMRRRWKTPAAPYNLAVTPDGRLLVATQKGPATTTIWRVSDNALLGEIPGTRKVASGVVVSADSRYAFVTLEGIGGDPGTVDIIDLEAKEKVASVEIGKQAGGVAMVR